MSLRGKVEGGEEEEEGEGEEGKQGEGEGQKRWRGGRGGRGRGGWKKWREKGERTEGVKGERTEGYKEVDTTMESAAEGAGKKEGKKREEWEEREKGEDTTMENASEGMGRMVDEATDTATDKADTIMENAAEGAGKMVDEATDTATDIAAEKAAKKAAMEAAEAEAVAEATRVLEGLDLRQILREAEEALKREAEEQEGGMSTDQEGGVNISQEGDTNTMPEDTNTEPEGGVRIVDTVIPPAEPAPLRISLQGLSTMGSARKSSVLYISPIDATSRLQRFAEAVRQHFVDAGLVVKEDRDLKLHATVLNTVYARHRGRKGKGRPTMLDFRGVVDLWKERVFVEDLVVDRVALCLMGAKERDGVKGAGGYEEVAGKAIFTDE
jgi:hypothetical protein